jgi:transposase
VGARLLRKFSYAFAAVNPHDGVMDSLALNSKSNMRLVFLPPYSPEINPAEHIWDTLRENTIGNTVFGSLDAADKALSEGLLALE